MHVALPEVDGRILSRAVSFKGEARYDAGDAMLASSPISRVPDRIAFVAELAAGWARLRKAPPPSGGSR